MFVHFGRLDLPLNRFPFQRRDLHHFIDKLGLDSKEFVGRQVRRFENKVHRAVFQSFERFFDNLFVFGTDHNDRQRHFPHDNIQGFHAGHVRHVRIHGHDVRAQLRDFFDGFASVPGRPHDLNPGVAFQDFRDRAARKRGVIHDEHPYFPARWQNPFLHTNRLSARHFRSAGHFRPLPDFLIG